MALGIAILLVIGIGVFITAPLLVPETQGEGALPIDVTPLTDLKRRRMVVYENLQDLDFEYKAGKISPGDYQSLRENHLAEAAQLMLASQEQEQVTENDMLIERQGGHGGRHRHAHPYRRRQGEHRPHHAARGPCRGPGAAHAH